MKTALSPYLMFAGNAAEAMEFYQSVLGGKLEMQTYEDAKMADSDDIKDRIIHGMLTSDSISFMVSDTHPKHSPPLTVGNNVTLTLLGDDSEKLTEYFNKLAEGGTIEMPLEKQFWGDVCGSVEDKFGVHWMVNISAV